jgi:beta-lactam-binding protein with PASTA domain
LRKILSAFGKLGVLALIAVVFALGLLLSVYLSLRSPEIQVPDVVNRPYLEGGATLEQAGLDIRERAARFKPGVQPGVILDQSPRAGEVIKVGQTVAVVVSRAPKEGEQPPDEEVAEERREEEKTGTRNTDDANRNENVNRERRRSANRNTNANANASANTNTNGANANRNAAPSNRNASNTNTRNSNLNGNRNAAPARNANTRNANSGPPRNANTRRPAATNTNRQP